MYSRRMARFAQPWIVMLSFALLGCSNAHVEAVNGQIYEARPNSEKLEIFFNSKVSPEVVASVAGAKWDKDLPAGCLNELLLQVNKEANDPNLHCIVVGGVTINGAQLSSWDDLLRQAEDRARELGGDAVLVYDVQRPFVGYDGFGVAHNAKTVDAMAVRYGQRK
jgi:hypothetical protein